MPKDDYTEWYQKYSAEEPNALSKDHDLVKIVDADELDAAHIEQRVTRSAQQSAVKNGFCVKCQKLFDNWPTVGASSTTEHDSTPDSHDSAGWEHAVARSFTSYEIEGAARSGCKFCAFMLQSLIDRELLGTYRRIEARLAYVHENAEISLSVQNWGRNPSQLLWLNLPGKVCTHCNCGIALEVAFESAFLPSSADCYDEPLDVLDIVSNWISDCCKNHARCKSEDGPLPSRLLSVASEPLRIVETSRFSTRLQYATLSHSWGSYKNVIKLTSKTLGSFTAAVPIENLPRTFVDAIKIAQRLKIDFIWIDSLCIIQDSESDWQRESSIMGSVYGGSTVTIAASSARDGTEGCLVKPANFNDGLRARITDGELRRVQDFRHGDVYDLSVTQTHLASRAWALQEKMLSARTIHFGQRGAFWECRTLIASEYLRDGFPKKLVVPLLSNQDGLKHLWPNIVRLYSAANLTFGKDKLPAISGIARRRHDQIGDQYLAGLWRAEIEKQLCWYLRRSVPMTQRPPWRAPTWSWASIDGAVEWFTRHAGLLADRYARALDVSITSYGNNPFGQVTGGKARLAFSRMVAGRLAQSEKFNDEEAEESARIKLQVNKEEQDFPVMIDCLEDIVNVNSAPVYLIPIYAGRTGSEVSEGEDLVEEFMIEGLVLRSTGVTKGEFSRIGCFTFYKNRIPRSERIYENHYDLFMSKLGEDDAPTAEAACAETLPDPDHSDERYVINLI